MSEETANNPPPSGDPSKPSTDATHPSDPKEIVAQTDTMHPPDLSIAKAKPPTEIA